MTKPKLHPLFDSKESLNNSSENDYGEVRQNVTNRSDELSPHFGLCDI